MSLTTLRGAGCLVAVVAAAAVLASQAAPPERIGAFALLLAPPLVAWAGRRHGWLGPAGAGRAARAARGGGYAALAACLLLYLRDLRYLPDVAPTSLSTTAGVVLGLVVPLGPYAAALLAATARASTLSATCLAAGAGAGVAAGLACFALMPFERVQPSLASGLPGLGPWLALVAVGAPVAAALLAGRRAGRDDQAGYALVCSALVATVVILILGAGAILLFPGQVPDIVPPDVSASMRLSLNVQEAMDSYVFAPLAGDLVIAMAGAALLAARGQRRRASRAPA